MRDAPRVLPRRRLGLLVCLLLGHLPARALVVIAPTLSPRRPFSVSSVDLQRHTQPRGAAAHHKSTLTSAAAAAAAKPVFSFRRRRVAMSAVERIPGPAGLAAASSFAQVHPQTAAQTKPLQAAAQQKRRALPLPRLSLDEEIRLGKRGAVERRRRQGRVGDAFVVVDTPMDAEDVWAALNDVESWATLMRGVKTANVRERRASDGAVRAAFTVTKLRLPANLVLRPSTETATLAFELDRGAANLAVDSLQGFWHVEPSPNGDHLTRVWLAASVKACAIVPNAAIDYVASKALRRATNWLVVHPAGTGSASSSNSFFADDDDLV